MIQNSRRARARERDLYASESNSSASQIKLIFQKFAILIGIQRKHRYRRRTIRRRRITMMMALIIGLLDFHDLIETPQKAKPPPSSPAASADDSPSTSSE
ncbi:hypothetical protein TorRG33x02_092100 [Trema orientale]|uniref:Uncharacterized protein n=1 Tax=Trema orientale TaxID=63057 RepID=A0A2P5FB46_TREOI|nr:hypothetical protein TorRG33x02_092100 [Trema orientale]